jgi:acyl-coenzyme A synthetase/AMP-(fatty) acid ligase
VILEVEGLDPLRHGEAGELCIGGVHVGRGYRNLPEQTIAKFITHPKFGRLYRTGDRCMIDPETQRVHFLGRIDAQLKVRGHRVEAQAVEDILQTQFSEIEAAVLDYQNNALVAFVAAPGVHKGKFSEVAPAPAAWADSVTAILAKQLPEPSVPSRIFLVEKFTMKPVSGKIDRKSLPDLSNLMHGNGSEKEGELSHVPLRTRQAEQIENRMPSVTRCSRSAGTSLRRRSGWMMSLHSQAATRSLLPASLRNCTPKAGLSVSARF